MTLLLLCQSLHAAIIPAASPAYTDVQTAINTAVDDDEVDIPGGTATWPNILSLTKSITIRGSGTNATHIINSIPPSQGSGYNNGHGGALIEVRSGGTWRITGIFFDCNRDGSSTGGGVGLEILGGSQNGRIDHCLFYKSPTYGVQTFSWNYGVIDHCQFTECKVSVSCNMDNQGAWLRPNPMGTTHQWVMEDNSIDMHGAWDSSNVGDGSYGASYTWRYNVCNSTYSGFDVFVENHGNQGPPSFATPLTAPSVLRSVVCMECYFNTLNVSTANGFFSHRGGTLFGFGNVATCADHSSVLGTFNFAHGGTEEDGWRNGNSPFTAWPPYDGITNSYFWAETVNGVKDAGFGLLFPGTTPCLGSFSSSLRCPSPASDSIFIQQNRDYWLHAPSTNFYRPLRYPHPRVLQDNDPPLPAVFGLASPADVASVSTQPTLQWNASAGANAYTVEVATDYYFTAIIHSATVQPILNSYPIPNGALLTNTVYFWRVKALNNNGTVHSGTLNTAEIRVFTTGGGNPPPPVNQPPATPSNMAPADTAVNVAIMPTLSASAYSDPQNSPQAGSQWFINHAGTNILTDFGGPNTSYAVAAGTLTNGTVYTWQVQYRNSLNLYSALSALTSFTTTNSAPVITNNPPATPVNVTPGNNATGISLTPLLTASPYSDPQGSAQADSQWLILHAGTNVLGTLGGAVTQFTVPVTLNYSTVYTWQARCKSALGLWSSYSTPTTFTTVSPPVPPAPPATPVNMTPVNTATGVSTTPLLVASAYMDPQSSTQLASQWQVYQAGILLWDSGTNVPNNGITVGVILATGTVYTWRVRYESSLNLWSAWSASTAFTTIPIYSPNQPVNVIPANGAGSVSLTPTLTASAYSDPNSPTLAQQAAEWLLRSNLFTLLDYTSGAVNALVMSPNILTNSITYSWQVRYQNISNLWSSYSLPTTFTTLSSTPVPPPTNTITVILNGAVILSGQLISK